MHNVCKQRNQSYATIKRLHCGLYVKCDRIAWSVRAEAKRQRALCDQDHHHHIIAGSDHVGCKERPAQTTALYAIYHGTSRGPQRRRSGITTSLPFARHAVHILIRSFVRSSWAQRRRRRRRHVRIMREGNHLLMNWHAKCNNNNTNINNAYAMAAATLVGICIWCVNMRSKAVMACDLSVHL